jgi:hypothetical protein
LAGGGSPIASDTITLTQLTNTEISQANTHFSVAGPVTIGRMSKKQFIGGERFFSGYLPEVILYAEDLTPAEVNRVESYLGLKYGVTLNQTVATDYIREKLQVIGVGCTATDTVIGRSEIIIQRDS